MVRQYLWHHRKSLVLLAASVGIFFLVFAGYRLEKEAVCYASGLCSLLWLLVSAFDFFRYRSKHREMEKLAEKPLLSVTELSKPSNLTEEDYQRLLETELSERRRLVSEYDLAKRERSDYDTMWVHQIKTPIAAMRLLLQEQDTPEYRELSAELFQVEQYVEMLLSYGRLTDTGNDLVIRYYELDSMIKQAVRKYAAQFVRRKLVLDRKDTEFSVLTDEKWLVFVLEQLISNAQKYTPTGGKILIYPVSGDDVAVDGMNLPQEQSAGVKNVTGDGFAPKAASAKCLVIEDTGIGIAAEDLPRIFEKGYTGLNGRTDKKSTGIGLYLCKKIMNKLGHGIRIESEVGKGTRVYLELDAYGEE